MAIDVQIATSRDDEQPDWLKRSGPFWKTPLAGYAFSLNDSKRLCYCKTTDGGATWGASTVLINVGIFSSDCFADMQVDGDTGTKIHAAYLNRSSDNISYAYLDMSDDSSAADIIAACGGTGAFSHTNNLDTHWISITKSVGGQLYIVGRYTDDGATPAYFHYTSMDGDTWVSETTPFEGDSTDQILLFPGAEADTKDIYALYLDDDASAISLKTYDDSGDSWSEQAVGTCAGSATYIQFDGQVRLSDGALVFVAWSEVDAATADLQCWVATDKTTVTAKTDVLTNTDNAVGCSVFIDQDSDDIYVCYLKGTAPGSLTKAYYKKSTDGGTTWGSETALQENAEDDHKWISAGCMHPTDGGRFEPEWHDDDDLILYTNYSNSVNISIAGGGGGGAGSVAGTAAAIQAALNALGGPGTVYIDAGEWTWGSTDQVELADSQLLIGAGAENTIINIPSRSNANTAAFYIPGGEDDCRIGCFRINTPDGTSAMAIRIGDYGYTCNDYIIDNMEFHGFGAYEGAIKVRAAGRGLICDSDFYGYTDGTWGYGVVYYGNNTYITDNSAYLGTAENLFIERCNFYYCKHGTSSDMGAHYVCRYCNFIQGQYYGQIDAHGGIDSNQVGTNSVEFYENTVVNPISEGGTAINIRGGQSYVWNNHIDGYHIARIRYCLEYGDLTQAITHKVHDSYEWNNTSGPNMPDEPWWIYITHTSVGEYLQEGVNFFEDTEPDGYTPYTYPHPNTPGTADILPDPPPDPPVAGDYTATIAGTLSLQTGASETINITITRPDGTVDTDTDTTDATGAYSYDYQSDTTGIFTVVVDVDADENYVDKVSNKKRFRCGPAPLTDRTLTIDTITVVTN